MPSKLPNQSIGHGTISIVTNAKLFNAHVDDYGELPNMKGRFLTGDFLFGKITDSMDENVCLAQISVHGIGIAPFSRASLEKSGNHRGFINIATLNDATLSYLQTKYREIVDGKTEGGHPSISLDPKPSMQVSLADQYEEAAAIKGINLQIDINRVYAIMVAATRQRGVQMESRLEVDETQYNFSG